MTSTDVKVPTIVVTEPTPAPVEVAAARVPTSMPQPQTSTDPAQAGTSGQPMASAGSTVIPIPNQPPVAISGGFSPLLDHQECTVNVEVDSSNPNVVPETTEEGSSDDLRPRTCWNMACEYFCKWAGDFRGSKHMIAVQIFFLIVPISAAYMGGVNINNCPMSPSVPVLIFMMGLTGCMVMVCQIVVLMQSVYMPERSENYVLTKISCYGYLSMFLLLFTEMASFIGEVPYSDPTDPDYCEETFYKYTFWTNWCAVFFIVLMIVVCAPKKCVIACITPAP